jgi:hypothetical protein
VLLAVPPDTVHKNFNCAQMSEDPSRLDQLAIAIIHVKRALHKGSCSHWFHSRILRQGLSFMPAAWRGVCSPLPEYVHLMIISSCRTAVLSVLAVSTLDQQGTNGSLGLTQHTTITVRPQPFITFY